MDKKDDLKSLRGEIGTTRRSGEQQGPCRPRRDFDGAFEKINLIELTSQVHTVYR